MFCPSRHALVQPGISSSYSVLMQHLKYLVEILFVCEIFSSHHEAIAMVRNLWWSCRGRKVKKLLLIVAADPQGALVSNQSLVTIHCKLFNCLLLGVKQTGSFRWQGTAIFQVKLQKQEIYKGGTYFIRFLHLLLRPLLMLQFKNKRYRTLEF